MGIRLVNLCIGTVLAIASGAGAQPAFEGPYHIEVTSTRRVRATLTETVTSPRASATEWSLTAAYPPNFEGQAGASATFRVDEAPFAEIREVRDSSPMRKPLVIIHWNVPEGVVSSGFVAEAQYDVTIRSREMVPGPSKTPVRALLPSERSFYLASNRSYDFRSTGFQTWLRKHDLKRRDGERDLDFGYRAFDVLSKTLAYKFVPSQKRSASAVCAAGWSDCGGLSTVYVAILRASGIPARCLVGWNLEPLAPHARAEFYARDVGWVPVEPAAAVSARTVETCFGRDQSDMVIMHIDLIAAENSLFFIQGFGRISAQGEGAFQALTKRSEMRVTELEE
jgi:transglutaminase-like putative cysteine protease